MRKLIFLFIATIAFGFSKATAQVIATKDTTTVKTTIVPHLNKTKKCSDFPKNEKIWCEIHQIRNLLVWENLDTTKCHIVDTLASPIDTQDILAKVRRLKSEVQEPANDYHMSRTLIYALTTLEQDLKLKKRTQERFYCWQQRNKKKETKPSYRPSRNIGRQ